MPEGIDIATVYRHHGDFVWRSLLRLGVPVTAVDDATQDVFLVAHRRRSDYDRESSIRGWLYGIARNMALKYRAKRRWFRLLTEAGEPFSEASPHEAAALREAAEVVDAFLQTLDADQREVFVLAEVEDVSPPEIAKILAVNLNTVYSRLRLARKRFSAVVVRHRARERRLEVRRHGQAG